ncbi:PREDICTED: non-structural maintenance of chromosomes element 3 homolog [Amphimedon queenslandica]|uniref:MAGE domain-containing protein n=1 Tax=Amphimedon queenslandica TaxID=400682 RepID=A0A1X7VKN9_AMPQE|nr:PREDICTED: non-structural maintenance of chromosomes element 3 homolog [Amphimedon queenslandica]|eukprot:XP_019864484.1 PREDICTED: non-structural maintenance of chromosomes element 3 homolog [Amphimedon queenslandica]
MSSSRSSGGSRRGKRRLETGPEPSQSSQQLNDSSTQSGRAVAARQEWDTMDSSEKSRKVKDLVRYLVFGSSQKIPVKRDELLKNVLDGASRTLPSAMQEANKILQEVFGLQAVEAKKGTQTVYLLINCLPSETKDKLIERSNKELSQIGLLGAILSFLMMKPQGTANTDSIWSVLNCLGLIQKSQYPEFGFHKDILSPFVEQGYLEQKKRVIGEASVFEYQWGPRAKLEVDKRQLLMTMAEVHGDEFDIWEKQFQDLI